MFTQTYTQRFTHIFGDDNKFRGDYYWALMESGVLQKEPKQFDNEAEVRKKGELILDEKVADKVVCEERVHSHDKDEKSASQGVVMCTRGWNACKSARRNEQARSTLSSISLLRRLVNSAIIQRTDVKTESICKDVE